MAQHAWLEEFPGAVTVCDAHGIILEMNERAAQSLQKDGGRALIGCSMLDCHPEPALSKVKKMLETRQPNIYTIEKQGLHKLIYQSPWFEGGEFRGFVELSLEIPAEMPHFIRG